MIELNLDEIYIVLIFLNNVHIFLKDVHMLTNIKKKELEKINIKH